MEFQAKQCILTKFNALQHRRAHSLPPSPRNQCWNWQSPRRTRCALVDSNIDFGGRGCGRMVYDPDPWTPILCDVLDFDVHRRTIAPFPLVKVPKMCMETLDTGVCRSQNCMVLFSKSPKTTISGKIVVPFLVLVSCSFVGSSTLRVLPVLLSAQLCALVPFLALVRAPGQPLINGSAKVAYPERY